eukprot:GHVP01060955.1.p1 GENE.GHVP01060955.1~~GHVP01060955.1.p1  ORF type:complete len:487 (-),score=93.35 GHVP01060955.1:1674-3134(-)
MKRQRESEDVEIILPKSMKTSHAKTTRKDTRQGFFLNSISDFGPASRQNANSICIRDILANDEDSGEAMEEVILCNYMIDLVWLLSECPDLLIVPKVAIIHGEKDPKYSALMSRSVEICRRNGAEWNFHLPPLPIAFGTFHSKIIIIRFRSKVRIVICTANFIRVDWWKKNQGIFVQDFPIKTEEREMTKRERQFFDPLESFFSIFRNKLPGLCSWLKKFDFKSARVAVVASVPGYHKGKEMKKWGHMALREILKDTNVLVSGSSKYIVQFSSLGSMTENWLLKEFWQTLTTSKKNPHGETRSYKPGELSLLIPEKESVRKSIEGWAAGVSIPIPSSNIKPFLKPFWTAWPSVGDCDIFRESAMPHIKTIIRHSGVKLKDGISEVDWIYCGSHNLSRAAWGEFQKKDTQFFIRSYEIGLKEAKAEDVWTADSQSNKKDKFGYFDARSAVKSFYGQDPEKYQTSNKTNNFMLPDILEDLDVVAVDGK